MNKDGGFSSKLGNNESLVALAAAVVVVAPVAAVVVVVDVAAVLLEQGNDDGRVFPLFRKLKIEIFLATLKIFVN